MAVRFADLLRRFHTIHPIHKNIHKDNIIAVCREMIQKILTACETIEFIMQPLLRCELSQQHRNMIA